MVFFFFFKQKTAYEMRISDWSSDVCSSDLPQHAAHGDRADGVLGVVRTLQRGPACLIDGVDVLARDAVKTMIDPARDHLRRIVVDRDDRDLVAMLEAEEPRLRRGIARKAVVAVEMVGAEIGEHRDVARKAVRKVDLITRQFEDVNAAFRQRLTRQDRQAEDRKSTGLNSSH